MPDLGRVSQIDASSFDAGTALRRGEEAAARTTSRRTSSARATSARTWTKIVSGIAAERLRARRCARIRRAAGCSTPGTQHGVYVSYDDGDTWQSLSLNLPDTPDLGLWSSKTSSLAIATHGRSFYVLDDLSVVRQAPEAAASTAAAVLFKPADAVRGGGPATVTYLLKSAAASLSLEILDGAGRVVQTIPGRMGGPGRGGRGRGDAAPASAPGAAPGAAVPGAPTAASGGQAAGQGRANQPAAPAADESEQLGGGGRGGGAAFASMAPGLNRVTWNLSYPGPTTFPGMVLWGATTAGPAALPGSYEVRLTVDGVAQTQPLRIRKHPLAGTERRRSEGAVRSGACASATRRLKRTSAVIQIRSLKQQIGERAGKSPDAALKASADRLTKGLSAIEEEIYQVRNQSNQDPLNFPIKINNRIAAAAARRQHRGRQADRERRADPRRPVGGAEDADRSAAGSPGRRRARLQRAAGEAAAPAARGERHAGAWGSLR